MKCEGAAFVIFLVVAAIANENPAELQRALLLPGVQVPAQTIPGGTNGYISLWQALYGPQQYVLGWWSVPAAQPTAAPTQPPTAAPSQPPFQMPPRPPGLPPSPPGIPW